jgi:hypothetical protein
MGQVSQQTYAWHVEDDYLEEHAPGDRHMAGLPETWRHYEWKLAAIVLAALWLTDTWTVGKTFDGVMSMHHIVQSMWLLIVVLTACTGLFHFWLHRRPSLGFHLCVLIALVSLVGHSL